MEKGDKYTFGENEKQIMRILDSFEQELDNLQTNTEYQSIRYFDRLKIDGKGKLELENVFIVKEQNENGEISYGIYNSNMKKIVTADQNGRATLESVGEIDIGDVIRDNEKEGLKGISENAEDIKVFERKLDDSSERKNAKEEEQEKKKEEPEKDSEQAEVENDLKEQGQDLKLSKFRKITDTNLHDRMPDVFQNSEESAVAYSEKLHGYVILTKVEGTWQMNENVETSKTNYRTIISVNEDGKRIEQRVPQAIMKTNREEKQISVTIGDYGIVDIETVDVTPCNQMVARSVRQEGETRDEATKVRTVFDREGKEYNGTSSVAHKVAHVVEEGEENSNEENPLNFDENNIDENAVIPETEITWNQLAEKCNEDVKEVQSKFYQKMTENGGNTQKALEELLEESQREQDDGGRSMFDGYDQGIVPRGYN